ncbi:MAG: methyltransferase domain-containing protein, partial [Anaerolineales bacterium]
VGVVFSPRLSAAARARAADRSVSAQVDFLPGDVETLHMDNGSFDAIICECAFCTFPDKAAAARGFNRVLKPGGGIGVSDLTRTGALDVRLNTLLAWVACVADARPAADYAAILTAAGLVVDAPERHDEVLDTIAEDVHLKLMGAEILQKLGKATLPPGLELEEVKALARSASAAIRAGNLGYAVILAHKPQSDLG